MLAAQVLVSLMRVVFTTVCGSTIFPAEMLAAQVLVCLSVGLKCWKFCWESCVWKFCWESCVYTVVCEYYLPFREVGCPVTCVVCLIGWFEMLQVLMGELCLHRCVSSIFPSEKLAAQLLVCLIGWFEMLQFLMGELCLHSCVGVLSSLQRSWLPRYLCALSVGLKCWKFCLGELCVSTIFPSEKLAAQVLVCLIGWFEVLEVLPGRVVCEYYLPFREVGCPGTCVPYRLV